MSKKSRFGLLVFMILALGNRAMAQPEMPPIQDIEKANFRALMASFEEKFTPIIAEQIHKKFDLQVLVSDNQLMKAEADEQGRKAIVRLYGGIPRNPVVTLDALALVVCHEIGHHLGGSPKRLQEQPWSSAEGQADYWGAHVCLKEIWEGQNHALYLPKVIKPEAIALCRSSKVNPEDYSFCLRGLMAAKSMTDLLKSMRRMTRTIDFDMIPAVPDTGTTMMDDPAVSCRFQTYIAAITNEDRPRCWFKP